MRARRLAAPLALLGLYALVTIALSPTPHVKGDEGPLLHAASRLAHGGYADQHSRDATEWIWHGPGLPALLVPLVLLHVPLWLSRLLVGPPLLLAAVLVFYRLVRLSVDQRRARIAAACFGCFFPLWGLLPTMRKEPLGLLLLAVGLWGTARALRGGRAAYAALAGAAFGWLALTKLEYGWVVIALLLIWLGVLARTRGRSPRARLQVVTYGVALVVCVPWLAYTHSLTGRTLYWGNSGGISLYWMSYSRGGELGDWHGVPEVFRDPRLAAHRPLFARLERLRPLDRDPELQRIAVRQVKARPLGYARNVAANVSRMLLGVPSYFRRPLAFTILTAVLSALLLAVLARACRRLWRRRGALPPETLPFALFAALGFLVHVFPSAEPRHLALLVPVLAWLVTVGLTPPEANPPLENLSEND